MDQTSPAVDIGMVGIGSLERKNMLMVLDWPEATQLKFYLLHYFNQVNYFFLWALARFWLVVRLNI